jgi:hypothetical protein
MNLLVDRFGTNPDILVAAVNRYMETGLEPDPIWVFDAMAEIPSIAEESILEREAVRFVPDGATQYAVAKAFLGVVEENDWVAALDAAAQQSPVQSPEWVTFLTAPDTGHGLTFPDDDSLDRTCSFFTDAENYRTVDVAPSEQIADQYVVRAYTDDGHCKLPSRKRCSSPGSCGALCNPRLVLQGGGYKCLCKPHSR